MVLTFVAAAHAAEPASKADGSGHTLIVIADLENGLALVPEGTVLPKGIMIYARAETDESTVTARHGTDANESTAGAHGQGQATRFWVRTRRAVCLRS
jgi:hypothetical protein